MVDTDFLLLDELPSLGVHQSQSPMGPPCLCQPVLTQSGCQSNFDHKQWLSNHPITSPRPSGDSDSKSKVMAPDEDKEPPSLQQVVLKVQQLDNVKHILNKGPWAVTPVVHQGWKVFIDVSHCYCLTSASY